MLGNRGTHASPSCVDPKLNSSRDEIVKKVTPKEETLVLEVKHRSRIVVTEILEPLEILIFAWQNFWETPLIKLSSSLGKVSSLLLRTRLGAFPFAPLLHEPNPPYSSSITCQELSHIFSISHLVAYDFLLAHRTLNPECLVSRPNSHFSLSCALLLAVTLIPCPVLIGVSHSCGGVQR
jgi:hypothetical protein